jgi:anti-sigma regulatory factor (Ser/Thr protein kinase)
VVSTTGAGSEVPAGDDARDDPPAESTSGALPRWELLPHAWRCQWRFPSDLSAVSSMRWELRSVLGETDLSLNEIEDLVLAVSEAANNAVEHAQDPRQPFFDVATEVDGGAVTIVVQDHGQWRPPTSGTGRGRGLAMMRALADISVATRAHGTTVTIRNSSATPSP